MAKQLGALDWLIILGLIIIAIFLIYLLRPLIIAVVILAAAYFIYKWYRARRSIAPT